jgi:hypothetical protein
MVIIVHNIGVLFLKVCFYLAREECGVSPHIIIIIIIMILFVLYLTCIECCIIYDQAGV